MSESGSYHEMERRVRRLRLEHRRYWPDRHPVAFALILVGWMLVVILAEPLANLVLRLIG